MDRFLQVAVILDRLVQVWHRALEDVLDDSLNEDMLFGSELGVVVVSDRLQDDVLLEVLSAPLNAWVDSNLLVDSFSLSSLVGSLTPDCGKELASFAARLQDWVRLSHDGFLLLRLC